MRTTRPSTAGWIERPIESKGRYYIVNSDEGNDWILDVDIAAAIAHERTNHLTCGICGGYIGVEKAVACFQSNPPRSANAVLLLSLPLTCIHFRCMSKLVMEFWLPLKAAIHG